jgi:hypothetical protein
MSLVRYLRNCTASPKLLGEWTLIIMHFAYGSLPPWHITPPPDEPGQKVTHIELLNAIEWFAIRLGRSFDQRLERAICGHGLHPFALAILTNVIAELAQFVRQR